MAYRDGLINCRGRFSTKIAGRDGLRGVPLFSSSLEVAVKTGTAQRKNQTSSALTALSAKSLVLSRIFRMTNNPKSESSVRSDGRGDNELRPLKFALGIAPYAHGSVLISAGNTQVICAATIESSVPRWMKEQGVGGGWLTAEYSMLPYSTMERRQRDISKGKLDGRCVEIQRLIGRSQIGRAHV